MRKWSGLAPKWTGERENRGKNMVEFMEKREDGKMEKDKTYPYK